MQAWGERNGSFHEKNQIDDGHRVACVYENQGVAIICNILDVVSTITLCSIYI